MTASGAFIHNDVNVIVYVITVCKNNVRVCKFHFDASRSGSRSILGVGKRRYKRLEQRNQIGDLVADDAVYFRVIDLDVSVADHIAQTDDFLPRNFRMFAAKTLTDPARGFAQNFQLAFDRLPANASTYVGFAGKASRFLSRKQGSNVCQQPRDVFRRGSPYQLPAYLVVAMDQTVAHAGDFGPFNLRV